MENVVGGLTGLMGHITEYLRSDDPHFPCDIVDTRHKHHCYFYQTSHMLNVFNRDFARVAGTCAESSPEVRLHCFHSYGRDVGGETRGDPAKAIRYCAFAPLGESRAACIEGAVQDRFWEESGGDEALTMCRLVSDEAAQDACYSTIIERAKDVLGSAKKYSVFCDRIPSGRRHWCDQD
jgi:hypothetical protein